VEAGEEPTEGCLARTRLSDQAHGLAWPDRNGHAFDRVNHVLRLPLDRREEGLGQGEVFRHVAHLGEWFGHGRPATSSLKEHAASCPAAVSSWTSRTGPGSAEH